MMYSAKGVKNRSSQKFDFVLYTILNLIVLSVFALGLCVHRWGERSWETFLSASLGRVIVVVGAVILMGLILLIARVVYLRKQSSSAVSFTILLQAFSLLLCIGSLELMIRILSKKHGEVGVECLGTYLLPRNFQDEVGRLSRLQDRFIDGEFYVYDANIGWTIRPSAVHRESLYCSSKEGVRSSKAGEDFRASSSQMTIALVGDSFTYGLGVPFEDSLGALIEKDLGSGVRVHNWGVSGYGIDQAVLKYTAIASKFSPRVVILGIFPDDFSRAMSVYPFIRIPSWDYFSKPRFIGGENLRLLNIPCIKAKDIDPRMSIAQLPLIEFEGSFNRSEWALWTWRFSYLARFIFSRYPAATGKVPQDYAKETQLLNSQILKKFIKDVRENKAVPILIYLPDRNDLRNPMNSQCKWLSEEGVDFVDMTSVVSHVSEPERYASDGHYSAKTNRLIAENLAEKIKSLDLLPPPKAP